MLSAITDAVTAITVASQEATIVVTTVLSIVATAIATATVVTAIDVVTATATVVTIVSTALHNNSFLYYVYDPLHFYYLFTRT